MVIQYQRAGRGVVAFDTPPAIHAKEPYDDAWTGLSRANVYGQHTSQPSPISLSRSGVAVYGHHAGKSIENAGMDYCR